ncbi:egg peptide speract receptor-like [Amphiura filiformis]|uniref:egg peptide speract receptor-like n=1 Tax=Amphiura filiformis TaxID=82378 RepID=UPI003B213D12
MNITTICCCVCFELFISFILRVLGESYISNVEFESTAKDNSGKVVVHYNDTWYQLCHTDGDYSVEAYVICRQLGYLGGWFKPYEDDNAFGIEIECRSTGAESLNHCNIQTGPQNCTKNTTFGVWCFNHSSVHLANSPPDRPNIGQVQVQYDDMLTEVCFTGRRKTPWTFNNLANLKVLCKQLGYPGALMTSQVTGTGMIQGKNDSVADVYTDDYKCHGGDEGLHKCLPGIPTNGPCVGNAYVHAVCAAPEYFGCFSGKSIDFKNVNDTGTSDSMTTRYCITKCQMLTETMRYAGLQGGNRCICIRGEMTTG